MGRPRKVQVEKTFGKRAVIYLRVSGEGQLKEGHGLDAQEEACLDYASRHQYTVIAAKRDEAISGTKGMDVRTGLYEALSLCLTGEADVFLCYAIDRQSRDVVIFNTVRDQLKQAGIRFETAKEAQDFTRDESMLMGDIYAAFAAEERRRITARMYGGRRQRSKIDGRGSGPIPYGYLTLANGSIVVDNDAAPTICALLNARDAGLTYQKTADFLNEQGCKPPRGKQWTTGQVFNIEQHRELYLTGRREWDGVHAVETWPAILTALPPLPLDH